jgi:hypothetical protein
MQRCAVAFDERLRHRGHRPWRVVEDVVQLDLLKACHGFGPDLSSTRLGWVSVWPKHDENRQNIANAQE